MPTTTTTPRPTTTSSTGGANSGGLYDGMWGAIADSFGSAVGLGSQIYGQESGQNAQTQEFLLKQEAIRAQNKRNMVVVGGLIGGIVLIVALMIIFKK